MQTFVHDIIDILKNKQLSVATCESVTGGMIGSNLVNIAGASTVYLGGLITYSNEAKIKQAKVEQKTIQTYGAVSKETALAMAEGAKVKFASDISLSITGNAGPTTEANKPIGLAYVTIIIIDKAYTYELRSNETERNSIRVDFTYQALSKL
jgi:PncC family amidohydrolase